MDKAQDRVEEHLVLLPNVPAPQQPLGGRHARRQTGRHAQRVILRLSFPFRLPQRRLNDRGASATAPATAPATTPTAHAAHAAPPVSVEGTGSTVEAANVPDNEEV